MNMFDPHEFYKISKHLYENFDSNEALLRTIIGRAYYSVYLACREWLRENFNINVNKEAKKRKISVHFILIDLIYEKRREGYFVDFIRELKEKRESSDYELKIHIAKEDAERAIYLAESVLNGIR